MEKKKLTETITKIGIIADFFVNFFDAMMDVDSFEYFDATFLGKKRAMRCGCHSWSKCLEFRLEQLLR